MWVHTDLCKTLIFLPETIVLAVWKGIITFLWFCLDKWQYQWLWSCGHKLCWAYISTWPFVWWITNFICNMTCLVEYTGTDAQMKQAKWWLMQWDWNDATLRTYNMLKLEILDGICCKVEELETNFETWYIGKNGVRRWNLWAFKGGWRSLITQNHPLPQWVPTKGSCYRPSKAPLHTVNVTIDNTVKKSRSAGFQGVFQRLFIWKRFLRILKLV